MEVIWGRHQAGECLTGSQDTASGEAVQRNTPALRSDPAHQGALHCPNVPECLSLPQELWKQSLHLRRKQLGG